MKFPIRFLSAFLVLLCVSKFGDAQFTVSGKITDANTGKTLGFASIAANDSSKKSITIADSTGNFSLPNLHA